LRIVIVVWFFFKTLPYHAHTSNSYHKICREIFKYFLFNIIFQIASPALSNMTWRICLPVCLWHWFMPAQLRRSHLRSSDVTWTWKHSP
jgi:hypothetical protein